MPGPWILAGAMSLTPSARKFILLALSFAVAMFAIFGWFLWRTARNEERRRHAEELRQAHEQAVKQEVEKGERELREKLEAARRSLETK